MLTTMIAAISTLGVLQTTTIPERAFRDQLTPPATVATSIATRADVDSTVAVSSGNDRLQAARAAMANGDFDIARREFTAAAAIDREAGKLPVQAMVGLADALYAQSYDREAAFTMLRLADAAALLGDVDTEAVALADAIWLNLDAGQRIAARKLSDRLRALVKDTPLSADTRKAIKTRLG